MSKLPYSRPELAFGARGPSRLAEPSGAHVLALRAPDGSREADPVGGGGRRADLLLVPTTAGEPSRARG